VEMSTSASVPAPNFGSTPAPAPQKRVLWKWSLALLGILLLFLMWQCGSALYQGRGLSNAAVRHFHSELNGAQYEEIWKEADEGFASSEKHDELVRFLEAVHRKLGNAGAESMTNLNVNATTGGTFITANYTTTFDQDQASETFIFRKAGTTLKLYRYNVQSNAFLK